jgi:hypothetical protein
MTEGRASCSPFFFCGDADVACPTHDAYGRPGRVDGLRRKARLVEVFIEKDLRPTAGLHSTNLWSAPATKAIYVRPMYPFNSTKRAFDEKCETFHTQNVKRFTFSITKKFLPLKRGVIRY